MVRGVRGSLLLGGRQCGGFLTPVAGCKGVSPGSVG
jgi:hypothetical protein